MASTAVSPVTRNREPWLPRAMTTDPRTHAADRTYTDDDWGRGWMDGAAGEGGIADRRRFLSVGWNTPEGQPQARVSSEIDETPIFTFPEATRFPN